MSITHDATLGKITQRSYAHGESEGFFFCRPVVPGFRADGRHGLGSALRALHQSVGGWPMVDPVPAARPRPFHHSRRRRAGHWSAQGDLAGVPGPSRGGQTTSGRRPPLNVEARRSGLVRELTANGASTRWYRPNVAAAIATIAQDAVLLFGDSQQRARLRRCENSSCRVVFFDDSRPGARRWCFPNRCGDRVRAREYRRRHA